jgi:predicted dehydrogenase
MRKPRNDNDVSRRDFIKSTGVAAAAGLAATSLVGAKNANASVRQGRILGANDRINFGHIGVGGMGSGHLGIILNFASTENVAVTGVCDVFEKRRASAKEAAKLGDDRVYNDYRRLLENKDIDAVVIATPDHWHSPIGIEAMDAGKHIYVEKPMTHTWDEAVALYQAAKRTKKLVQVGSHGCSDPKWHKARELITQKKLGKVLWAQGSYCRNNPNGEWNYTIEPEATEANIDWKMWLGSAKKRPFSAERYYRWRKFWDYGTGIIGDLWPHRLHPLMLAMNLNEFPSAVSCSGGILVDTDTGHGEPRDVADTTLALVQFPSGTQIFLAGATVNERGVEDVIRGHKANLLLGGLKVEIQPERPFVEEIEAKDETPPDSGETHAKHQKNFIDSMRKNVPPNCDIELGIRVQAVVSMSERAYRTGKTMHFDANKMKITG